MSQGKDCIDPSVVTRWRVYNRFFTCELEIDIDERHISKPYP